MSGFSLFKHSNGVYYVLYYENGRRRWKSTGCKVKTEALKRLTEVRELLSRRSAHVSFDAFRLEFLAFAEQNLSSSTVRLYKAILARFGGILRGASVDEVTAEVIDKYKTKRLKEVSPVSVNVDLRMLKAAFATARRWGFLKRNPFDDIQMVRVPERAPLHLSQEELEKLLSSIRENWLREIVIFAVLTGLRRGEILNLRWSDVDLNGKLANIETNATWKTKQGKRRTIPLGDTAVVLLRSRLGRSCSEYVFTLNDKQISASWLTHLFKRYVRQANLSNPKLRFHSLRHTTATNLIRAGVHASAVQKILGHSSLKVTEGYVHLLADELHSAVNKIDIPLN